MDSTQLSRLPPELLDRVLQFLDFEDKLQYSLANSDIRNTLIPDIFQALKISNSSVDRDGEEVLSRIVEKYGKYVKQINFNGHASPTDDEGFDDEEIQVSGGRSDNKNDQNQDESHSGDEGNDCHEVDNSDNMNTDQADARGDGGDVKSNRETEQNQVSTSKPKWDPSTPALPIPISKLLSGEGLPKLQTVKVHFPFDWEQEGWVEDVDVSISIHNFDEPESDEFMENEESRRKWRALMVETWRAIASNERGLQKLIVQDLVPKRVSVYSTPEFKKLLGKLEEAEISILELNNGCGWCFNTQDGYISFGSWLAEGFFKHMKSIRRLRFAANKDGPYGLEGMNHCPLPLQARHLPALEELELEFMFVGPEFLEFLKGHAASLKSLVLRNCMSSWSATTLADNAITWAHFFSELRQMKPVLSTFKILNDEVKLESNKILYQDSPVFLFRYCILDDKYGMLFDADEVDGKENLENEDGDAFDREEDQRQYDALMEIVHANADNARR